MNEIERLIAVFTLKDDRGEGSTGAGLNVSQPSSSDRHRLKVNLKISAR